MRVALALLPSVQSARHVTPVGDQTAVQACLVFPAAGFVLPEAPSRPLIFQIAGGAAPHSAIYPFASVLHVCADG